VSNFAAFVVFVISILLTARWTKGIRVKSVFGAVVFAVVLSILNYFLFGLLVVIGFPLLVITLGLGIILINALLWWMAAKLVSAVEIDGYGAAIKASIVTSLISWVLGWLVRVVF
jgi:putative membrane protein